MFYVFNWLTNTHKDKNSFNLLRLVVYRLDLYDQIFNISNFKKTYKNFTTLKFDVLYNKYTNVLKCDIDKGEEN